MQVLAAVDPHLLYSKFATKGIRPDARVPSDMRSQNVLADPVKLSANECSCMVRLGDTAVLVAAEIVGCPQQPEQPCMISVQYPAVGSGSTASGSQDPAQLISNRLDCLWQKLGVVQWTQNTEDDRSRASEAQQLRPSLYLRAVLLADDGCAFDALVAACAWCCAELLIPANGSNEKLAGRHMRMSVYPVAATVSALSTASASEPMLVRDPSSASGEDLPRRTLQLTAGVGASSVVATMARAGGGKGAGTDGLGQGLGQGQVTAVIDAWSGNVLDLSVEQVKGGLSGISMAAIDDAVTAALGRAAEESNLGRLTVHR